MSSVLAVIRGEKGLVVGLVSFHQKNAIESKDFRKEGHLKDRSRAGMNRNFNLLGVVEVAARLGVKVETLYSWIHKRQIPYYKIGRLVKFKEQEVDGWIESKRVGTVDLN